MSQSQRPVSLDDDHLSLSPVVGRIEPDASVYDALTDLFLGEVGPDELAPKPEEPPALQQHPRARLESLVLGHLPVLGSAWASQYVRHAASTEGQPIAYVRLQSAYASVEIISPSTDHPPITDTRTASFQQAIRAARSHTDRWIVRTDDPAGPSSHFALTPDLVTLLTSADEAAVVGAYRTLKQLRQAAPDESRFRLVVLGNDAARTDAVSVKLTEAAQSFLDLDIDRVLCDGRIHASQAPTLLFSGSCPDAEMMLAELLDESLEPASDADAAAAEAGQDQASSASFTIPDVPTSDDHAETPVPTVPDIAEPISSIGLADDHAEQEVEPTPDAPTVPARRDAETPMVLAELIPNSIALPFTCPFTELIELAMDANGQAHVMASATDEASLHRAVAELARASAWLTAHTGLIRATLPSATALRESEAVQHVFVSEPRLGRALLETPIRMHLLADCTVTTRDQRYHAELN